MAHNIKEIIELANVYGWNLYHQYDWHINLRNENGNLLSVYWNSKHPNFTVIYQIEQNKKKKRETRKGVNMEMLENIFKNHNLFTFDDPGCTCQKCGNKYKVDLIIPDALWEIISPKKVEGFKGGGLLCGSCIMQKIEEISDFDAYRLEKHH